MLSDRMEKALNGQVNAELYSAYLYLAMSSYFKSMNLNGFGRWMEVQTLEELTHAKKFFDYVNERGGRAVVTSIDGPQNEWASPVATFEQVYQHEQKVSGLINELVNLAIEERDHATNNFLQWFVSEQVEEEASANDVLQKLKLIDRGQGGLFLLDQELGQRVFTPPPGTTILAGAGQKAAKA